METSHALSALAALSQEDRLAAFRLLVRSGPDGLPSGTIAEKLDILPNRMSFHLTTLERAGLLQTRREGRLVRYAVSYKTMTSLLEYLVHDCCDNNPEICCFDMSVKPTTKATCQELPK